MSLLTLSEARPLTENIADVGPKRMRIRLIKGNVWGSSGYYAQEVLKRDGPKVFPAGTQMYLDHPTETEEFDRPERSIRDLVGVLESDARYAKDGLYADVRIYPHWAPVISEMAKDIGVSIRATARAEEGERDGQRGPVFSQLVEGISVDLVTKAGAGGEITQIIESARKVSRDNEEGDMTESKEATSKNRRDQLERALSAAYPQPDMEAWVRDLDETESTVYFSVYSAGEHRMYGQKFAPSDDDRSVSLEGDRWEVMTQTEYVPVPTTSTTTTTSESDDPTEKEKPSPEAPGNLVKESEMGDTTIKESELTSLRETAARVPDLETQLAEAKKEGREARVAETKATIRANREHARRVAEHELREAGVKAPTLAQNFSIDPPLTEDGTVDEEKLKESVKAAVDEIQVEVDEASGGVRGFGASKKKDEAEDISEAEMRKLSDWAFGRETEEVKG